MRSYRNLLVSIYDRTTFILVLKNHFYNSQCILIRVCNHQDIIINFNCCLLRFHVKLWLQYIVSLSYSATSTDLLDHLSPLISIVHRFRKVFKPSSCITTELLYIGSSWSSCLCSSMRTCPLEYIAYEFVSTSTAVSCMFGLSNIHSFREGW